MRTDIYQNDKPLCRSIPECISGKFTNCDKNQLDKFEKYIKYVEKEEEVPVWPADHYTNDSICGYANPWKKTPSKKISYASWCDPESETPCCDPPDDVKFDDSALNDFHMGKYSTKKSSPQQFNATCISSKWCQFGISYLNFTWPEACEYSLPDSSIKYFSKEEILEKLRGKVIRIIGDSHSRNMFNTLLFLLTGDFNNAGIYLPYAISKCRGAYDIYTVKSTCRNSGLGLEFDALEKKVHYKRDGIDISWVMAPHTWGLEGLKLRTRKNSYMGG